MPVNIGIIFLVGGLIGWVAVKALKPPKHLRGLIIASCSAGSALSLIISPFDISFQQAWYYLVLEMEINLIE